MLERVSSVEQGSISFADRRRTRRRRIVAFAIVFILLLLAGIAYGLRQSSLRISHVDVIDADPSLADYATNAIKGWYLGIIPRDSIFFFPEDKIRSDIMFANAEIAAVSITRNGLGSISVKPSRRVSFARWCGLAQSASESEQCYIFDSSGVIFTEATTSIITINSFKLYAPLEGDATKPMLGNVANIEKLSSTFDFARQLDTYGSPVTAVEIRADEVVQTLESGTRVTYVFGHEREAYTALVSARDNFNLSDGSVEYVDLRFGGKVYVKKKSDTVTQ